MHTYWILAILTCCSYLQNVISLQQESTDERLKRVENNLQELVKKVDLILEEVHREKNSVQFRASTDKTLLNDTTIEERVALLEFQVAALTEDTNSLGSDLDAVEDEVIVISSQQILQDQRIVELEIDSDGLEDSVESLIAVDTELSIELALISNRVTDVNQTVLEVDSRVGELDATLVALEDTVTQIDGRVSQLEVSGTVAFHADLNSYTSIPSSSVVIFDTVNVNLGNGYASTTGQFTVPSGGAGLYFLYTNFYGDDRKHMDFFIRVNGNNLCAAFADMHSSGIDDNGTPSCGAVAQLAVGDVVDVYYGEGSDDVPVNNDDQVYNTFTGFRIAPE